MITHFCRAEIDSSTGEDLSVENARIRHPGSTDELAPIDVTTLPPIVRSALEERNPSEHASLIPMGKSEHKYVTI